MNVSILIAEDDPLLQSFLKELLSLEKDIEIVGTVNNGSDCLESVERLLYSVDEWLRFRTGDSRWSLFFKPVLGLGWFFLTYLIRVFINLFFEPTVNPIKHFPVVTVSHKVILPLSIRLTRLLAAPLSPLGPRLALFIAGTTVLLIPGVFGFLVWELKENWRLYESNRPEKLVPVTV